MVKDDFEEKLNSEVRSSSYEVKTSASQILSTASASKAPKKRFLASRAAKGWFFGTLSGLAVFALVFALVSPLMNSTSDFGSDGFTSTDITEPSTTILDARTGALSYELASIMPSFTSGTALESARLFAKKNTGLDESEFSSAVDAFDQMQSASKEALVSLSTPNLSAGSFVGSYGTYPYCLTFANGLRFFFDLDVTSSTDSDVRRGKDFSGEIMTAANVSYLASGTRLVRTNGARDIALKVYRDATAGDYYSLEQNTSKGTFYFSVAFYADSILSYSYSVHLVKASSKNMLQLSYSNGTGSSAYVFQVYRNTDQSLLIYVSWVKNPITLVYSGDTREYTYGDFSSTKKDSSNN